MSLARYASDRGDAERGLSLLRRAGATAEHDLAVLLERFQPAPRPGLGRNHPCWCGSGRKYKVCHLRRERLPQPPSGPAWLYQRKRGQLSGWFLGAHLGWPSWLVVAARIAVGVAAAIVGPVP